MKINASKPNNITIIKNYNATESMEISGGEAVMLLGMNRAYQKLKSRIQREGLFTLALESPTKQILARRFYPQRGY